MTSQRYELDDRSAVDDISAMACGWSALDTDMGASSKLPENKGDEL